VRSAPAAAGVSEVLVPGDRGARARAEGLDAGVPVAAKLWETLLELQTPRA
jgi:LDH2 family malate/lactate/ureidoglycolate dehydrogenase